MFIIGHILACISSYISFMLYSALNIKIIILSGHYRIINRYKCYHRYWVTSNLCFVMPYSKYKQYANILKGWFFFKVWEESMQRIISLRIITMTWRECHIWCNINLLKQYHFNSKTLLFTLYVFLCKTNIFLLWKR